MARWPPFSSPGELRAKASMAAWIKSITPPVQVPTAMPESQRASLAALGLPAQVLRAQQPGYLGPYAGTEPRIQIPSPSPNAMLALSSPIQSFNPTGSSMYGGGTFGRAPPMRATTPMQAYGGIIPQRRPLTSAPSLPPLRLQPGGNLNPYNVSAMKARGIDPYGPKAYQPKPRRR